jgi:SAM-dependent methyltransferase
MALTAEIVKLSDVPLDPVAMQLREKIVRASGEESHNKSFPIYDWQRLSYAYSRLQSGQRCLEVGPGRGYLTTMMWRQKKFEEVHAIDIVDRVLPKNVLFQKMSVDSLEYEDKHFDCVICMEVLEHLDDEQLYRGLAEIRRVSRSQLVMSVPYCEPLPLPKYHKQSFDEARIREMFPNARYSLLLKEPIMRVPWLLMEESFG